MLQASSAAIYHHQPLSLKDGHKDPERAHCKRFGLVRSFNVSVWCSCIESSFPPSAHTRQLPPYSLVCNEAHAYFVPRTMDTAKAGHLAWGFKGKGLGVECGGCKQSANWCGLVCFVAETDKKCFTIYCASILILRYLALYLG